MILVSYVAYTRKVVAREGHLKPDNLSGESSLWDINIPNDLGDRGEITLARGFEVSRNSLVMASYVSVTLYKS